MRNLFKIATRNVFLNWRHSLAALLSISAGFIALSLFQGYIADVKSMYEETFFRRGMLGHVLVEKKGAQSAGMENGWKDGLGAKEQAFLDQFLKGEGAEVVNRIRFLQASGMVSNGRTNTIFVGYGYDVQEGATTRGNLWRWNTLAGKPLELGGAETVVVGKSLGSILDCKPDTEEKFLSGVGGYTAKERPFTCTSDRLQMTVTTDAGQVNAMDAQVGGIVDAIFKEVDTKFIAMPLPMAQRLLDTSNVSYYGIELAHPEQAPAFMSRLHAAATAQGLEFDANRWQEHPFGDLFVKTMELLGIFRTFVVAVILTIAGLSVLNTLVKIVTERTRETGMLRSIGFLRRDILVLFTVEAILLALLGNLMGLGATGVLTWVINHSGIIYKAGMLSEPVPFRIGTVPMIYLKSAVFLCIIAVFAAVFPARKSSRTSIPEALSHI